MSEPGLFEAELPARLIARVAVDVPLAHLDRLFDYEIPDDLDADVVPGCRVIVRFAGRQVNGFVISRDRTRDYDGRIAPILKVPSAEPVLRPDVYELARQIARRYGGVVSDVLRLAIPARQARTERDVPKDIDGEQVSFDQSSSNFWAAYQGGPDVIASWERSEPRRIVMSVRPDQPAPAVVAEAVVAAARSGRGVIVCVADARDLARYQTIFDAYLGKKNYALLNAAQGRSARYRAFLRLSRGHVRIALGTRGATYAPVHDLGLAIIVDDGDDLFVEPRAPYAHAREVLLTRASLSDSGVLIAATARSTEAQRLVESGWCEELGPTREERRTIWPRISVADDAGGVRLPPAVFSVIRDGLAQGPVLVHVPRSGYRSGLACQDCRTPARCTACSGPLRQANAGEPPSCWWCARLHPQWRCQQCSSAQLRAPVIGAVRLAEELGKAFVQVGIKRSSGDHVLDDIDDEPQIVIATPGAEPYAAAGYAAGVILDTRLALSRPALRVTEECYRRWFNAAALVRPAKNGGRVVAVGDAEALQPLVRADPVGFASRELQDRAETHLPPAAHVVVVEGAFEAVKEESNPEYWPDHAEILGPVPLDDRARTIVRVPRAVGPELGDAVHRLNARRTSKKLTALNTRIDPYDL